MRDSPTALARMTQPSPEPFYFDPPEGSDASETPDLLGRRSGLVAVLVTDQAHQSGWASRTAVALAEASLAAGNTVGLVDLALDEPKLQTAAGTDGFEGLSDIVLFGASVDRVSGWSPGGARVIGAGTPVDMHIEGASPSGWLDATRLAQDGGCVLAYVRAGSAFEEAVASQADDVIVLRHAGEEVTMWSGNPSLVLEPTPAPTESAPAEDQPTDDQLTEDQLTDPAGSPLRAMAAADAEIEISLDDGALDDGSLDGSVSDDRASEAQASDPADAQAAPVTESAASAERPAEATALTTDEAAVADEPADPSALPGQPNEVSVDLDDVAGDSEGEIASMFTPPPTPTAEPQGAEPATAEVAGLEVEPEWPDFEQPLVVHEPGEVDPLVAAGSGAPIGGATDPAALDDIALDDILGEGAEVKIVSDDLGTGTPVAFDEEVTSEVLDGLVNPSMQSLSPAGGEDLSSADHVAGLEAQPGWDGLPGAEDLGVHEPSEALGTVRDHGPAEPSTFADDAAAAASFDLEKGAEDEEVPEDELDVDDAVPVSEAMRLEDPWGEPEHVAPAAEVQPTPEALEGFDEAFAEQLSDPLPWEADAPTPAPAEAPQADVPVANVTRTRTRTRTKGPRPFLLILILLLIATVAVLQWVGLLDVAGLDFLREGGP